MKTADELSKELLSMLIERMDPWDVTVDVIDFNGKHPLHCYKCSFSVYDGTDYRCLAIDYSIFSIELESIANIELLANHVASYWEDKVYKAVKAAS